MGYIAPSMLASFQKQVFRNSGPARAICQSGLSGDSPADIPDRRHGMRRGMAVGTLRGCWTGMEQMHIIICGHSMVFRAPWRAANSSMGSQLGLSRGAVVQWLDRQGMHGEWLLPALFQQGVVQIFLQAMVIHLGGNDRGVNFYAELNCKLFQELLRAEYLWVIRVSFKLLADIQPIIVSKQQSSPSTASPGSDGTKSQSWMSSVKLQQ
ncbi:uncharacterized protein LOC133363346 [Rhineura floridana]|uniref:uncharacterized protein LOC133363346 n=1 Tax=Rhineura floridana TaxID=261503 RepID=UPI002AC7FEEA|nr:uncharacterized protein LOC133363346 [Rhineura floridana]